MSLGPQIGPIEGAFGGFVNPGPVACKGFLGPRASKTKKVAFSKTSKILQFFQGFWAPEASEESLRRPKRGPKRPLKSSKTSKKRDPKIDHKIMNFWTSFGTILGPFWHPKFVQKGTQNGTHF